MSYVLREYQELAVDAGYKSLTASRNNEVIVAPTASGKSLIISELCHRLKGEVLILQPTKEILEQNYDKLTSYGIQDIGIYSASMNRKDINTFTYATIGSIYKNPNLFKHFKYVIIDECHLVNPKGMGMYKTFFKALNNPSILGLTATPYRLVQNYYRDGQDMYYTSMLQVLNRISPFFFRSFCFKITNKRLFEEKYLSPIEYVYPQKGLDTSELRINTTGADYDADTMDRYVNSPANIQNLVNSIIQEDAKMKNNLIFCSSIKHANNSANLLARMGYDCEIITGTDGKEKRETIINNFKTGKIKRLLNVGVLTTGFDMPTLYGVTLARPTMSLALYYQIVGRMIRLDPANPNKVGRFVDVVGASKKMGRIETIRLGKDGFKDQVETEKGVMSGIPLFTYHVTDKNKLKILKV